MFIAQAAPGTGDFIGMILPLVLIMGVFYFLLIRPQQKKAKDHQAMLAKVAKGDTVVTHEIQVEIGENVKVRVLRGGIHDVRAKGEPAK
jgi:preprotein translocase subunit YajC